MLAHLDLIRLLCVYTLIGGTAKGMYRLSHAIYYRSSPVSDSPLVAQPTISGTAHAQLPEGLHFSVRTYIRTLRRNTGGRMFQN